MDLYCIAADQDLRRLDPFQLSESGTGLIKNQPKIGTNLLKKTVRIQLAENTRSPGLTGSTTKPLAPAITGT